MKDIRKKIAKLLKKGYCTPHIVELAKKLKTPSTTLHYNIKKLEENEAIKEYKAVFNYKKIDQGYCSFVLINLSQEHYGTPEKIAKELAKDSRVESVDVVTGEYELIIKLRTKDIDEYYEFIKSKVKKFNFRQTVSLTSLKQIKTEFVKM